MFSTHDVPTTDNISEQCGSILESARETAGEPSGGFRFREPLDRLVRALDVEAHLTPAGRARARRSLVRALVEQVETGRRIAERPELTRTSFRPIIITGLLRTGTTFLQHLLAHHPLIRAPALWEMMAPARRDPPEELIRQCASYISEYDRLAPDFKHIHPLHVGSPEECHRLTGNTFCDPIFALRYRVPSYGEWMDRRSMVPVYRYHRTQLQVLLDRVPGDHVLLKGPSHLWYLDDLAVVYPDALVVRMHRSPAVALPSVCNLTSVVRAAGATTVDDREIGRYWVDRAASALDGLRHGTGPFERPPLDVRYADLVADPMAVVADVCAAADLPLTDDARHRMERHLRADHGPGAHSYQAERFGLSADELTDRFSAYLDEFAVPHDGRERV